MDATFWSAMETVIDFVEKEGSSKRTVDYHRRGINQLARHLDESGSDCTAQAIQDWLDQGRCIWSNCKFKENRTSANRLLEVIKTGSVSPTPYSHSHIGPSDYSMLSGWSRRSVDAYCESAKKRFSDKEARLSRLYASQFLVHSGLHDALPDDITADVIICYVRECPGAKSVRASRLSHLRGFLLSLAERGEIPLWAPMLASERFSSKSECYEAFRAPDATGADPSVCMESMDSFVAALRSKGYASTSLRAAKKAIGMLYIALSLNVIDYTPANAQAWLKAASLHMGSAAATYTKAIRMFNGFLSDGVLDTAPLCNTKDPMGAAPQWAVESLSAYLSLRSREGCSKGTLSCTRRACIRLASYADSAGIRSWKDLDADLVAAWCVNDPHDTAEGRANYISKAKGLLRYLGEEGIAPPGVWLAACTKHSVTRKVVTVLDACDIALADKARILASTPMELRDAAIISLGLTMGLRSCDVVGLKLSDISWKARTITIVQKKTGAQLDLPLTIVAGNAIASYLRSGRPASSSPLVFVKHRAPYDRISKSACRRAMDHTFRTHIGGFHTLRRTFATSMLRGGAGRADVAQALGHRTEKSIAPYLSLDDERMRMCALSPIECGIGARQ